MSDQNIETDARMANAKPPPSDAHRTTCIFLIAVLAMLRDSFAKSVTVEA